MNKTARGFTLVELLVTISIISIITAIVVIQFNPLELTKQGRDSTRLDDLQKIRSALTLNQTDPNLSLCGTAPPPCSGKSTDQSARAIDGTGWIKINLSSKVANFTTLPIDPVNDANLYYNYVSDGQNWEITTTLESNKYKDMMKKDGGPNDNKYEIGNNLTSTSLAAVINPSPNPTPAPTSSPTPTPTPTPNPIVASDSFNRPNSANSLGQSWNVVKGTFGIINNQAYVSSGCPAPAYALVNAGITDATVQVTLAVNAQDARIPFRYVDLNNMYWLEAAGNSYVLNKYLNGTRSQPASTPGIVPASGDTIKIVLSGNTITVYINGTIRIAYTDNSNPINGTSYGIGTWCGTSMRFDDFSVSTTPPPVALNNNTSFDMKVLVLKYFPLTSNSQNIDINVTGDVGGAYTTIRQLTTDVDNNLLTDLPKSTSYLGYKNGSATPSLRYSIVDTKEYTQAVPFDPTTRRPLYTQILNGVNICNYVNNLGVNEVWMWAYQGPNNPSFGGLPYLAISESKMSGPFGDISNSYRGNDMPVCSHTYRLYTFNYGRGTAEAIHSWGHQIEAEMSTVDSNLWSIFQGPHNGRTSNLTTRCGDVHSPPNASGDYDYGNSSPWNSDCLNWTPDNMGSLSQISCSNWGCASVSDSNNPQLNYLIWMYQNIPGMNNAKTYQGKQLRNWWDVHGDFDNVMGNNRRLTEQ